LADRSKAETVILNKLVSDCITYGLKANEALKYIEIEFGQPISPRSYRDRKAKLMSENTSNLWLSYFTRIGFVQHHKEQIDNIKKVQDERLKQFFIELQKPIKERNDAKISRINHDIRENARLLSELGLGTPILASIKRKIEENNNTVAQTIPER
jgi:hypothetical protein